jgi:hypothetical protein
MKRFFKQVVNSVQYPITYKHFLLPSCQIDAYMKVSMSWPDMAFCFMPGASHHHKDKGLPTNIEVHSTPFLDFFWEHT